MVTQKTSYGCGLYAVANALGLENFITMRRLDASHAGNNIGQLTFWLAESGFDKMYLEPIYLDPCNPKLNEVSLNTRCSDTAKYMPVLFLIMRGNGSPHLVAGHVYAKCSGGAVKIMDSLAENGQEVLTTLEEFSKTEAVYGMYAFCDSETGYVMEIA